MVAAELSQLLEALETEFARIKVRIKEVRKQLTEAIANEEKPAKQMDLPGVDQ